MTVEVLTCNAVEILRGELPASSDRQAARGELIIPEYQRPYCWQEQQLSQLLNDIKSHNEQASEHPYYLGSLILLRSGGRLNIIDGQQRVTTLALIACVLGCVTEVELSFESPQS